MVVRRRQRQRNYAIPRRILWILDRPNPLEGLSEEDIYDRYRFFPVTIFSSLIYLKTTLCIIVEGKSSYPLFQVLIALRFFATGSYYITIRDTLNISKSAVGRTVRHVSNLLCQLANEFMQIPRGEELVQVKIECR